MVPLISNSNSTAPTSTSTPTTWAKKAQAMRTYFQQKNYGPAQLAQLTTVAPLPAKVQVKNGKSLLTRA